MAGLEQVEQLLATVTLAGPVDDKVIQMAEKELGVLFPPSYRFFLSKFGAALCTGFELAGLFDKDNTEDGPPLWSDVVTTTLQERRASESQIPDSYVPVSDDGGDYTFYLDTARVDSRGECPVVVLGPGADGVVVAEDFFDFIVRLFEGNVLF
ncbi:MAG: SMI1/KNR4 family protein [Pirellulales bacterium]|nr:SMI1/KNR4 family protein [Pirellulales bacterium]